MLNLLRDSRQKDKVCLYSILGQIIVYPMTKDDGGLWRVSFRGRRRQLAPPYATLIQDYELIMRPSSEQAKLVFRITAIEISDEG